MQLYKPPDREPTEVTLEDWGISLIVRFTVAAYKAMCVPWLVLTCICGIVIHLQALTEKQREHRRTNHYLLTKHIQTVLSERARKFKTKWKKRNVEKKLKQTWETHFTDFKRFKISLFFQHILSITIQQNHRTESEPLWPKRLKQQILNFSVEGKNAGRNNTHFDTRNNYQLSGAIRIKL